MSADLAFAYVIMCIWFGMIGIGVGALFILKLNEWFPVFFRRLLWPFLSHKFIQKPKTITKIVAVADRFERVSGKGAKCISFAPDKFVTVSWSGDEVTVFVPKGVGIEVLPLEDFEVY